MSTSCDCSMDIEGQPEFSTETFPVSRKEHKCCECGEIIPAGFMYNFISGKWEGEFLTFKTCMACYRIRSYYCPRGYNLTELREHLEECLGFDYTEVPESEDN